MTPGRITSVRPTKVAAGLTLGVVLLFGVGTNVGVGWVLGIAAICGATLILGALLPFRAAKGVLVERRAPARASAGGTVRIGLSVRGRGRRVVGPTLLRDRFCGEGTAVVSVIPPGRERTYDGERTGARRGVHTSGSCEIVTGAPFGVVVVHRTVEVASTTVVHPRVFDIPLAPLLGPAPSLGRATSGDVATIREYRPRDPLRLVHWRSTARRGELMVKEFEDQDRADVVVVADAPSDPDVADAVASAACSLALAALAEARDVELAAPHAARHRVTAPESILDWGARLAPSPGGTLESVLDTLPDAQALVCVLEGGPRTAGAVHRLAALARQRADVLCVFVGGTDGAAFLAGAGARVVEVPDPEEVEACLRGSWAW